jgi:hypothetical protein
LGNSPLGSDTAGARTLSIFQVLKAVHQGAPLIPGILVSVRYLSYSSFICLFLRLYTAKRVGICSLSSVKNSVLSLFSFGIGENHRSIPKGVGNLGKKTLLINPFEINFRDLENSP